MSKLLFGAAVGAGAAWFIGGGRLRAKSKRGMLRHGCAPEENVSVDVDDGIAYLRGEVEDRSTIERLREAAAKVDGIRAVESLLHTPGEPAPTKDEGRTTAGTGA